MGTASDKLSKAEVDELIQLREQLLEAKEEIEDCLADINAALGENPAVRSTSLHHERHPKAHSREAGDHRQGRQHERGGKSKDSSRGREHGENKSRRGHDRKERHAAPVVETPGDNEQTLLENRPHDLEEADEPIPQSSEFDSKQSQTDQPETPSEGDETDGVASEAVVEETEPVAPRRRRSRETVQENASIDDEAEERVRREPRVRHSSAEKRRRDDSIEDDRQSAAQEVEGSHESVEQAGAPEKGDTPDDGQDAEPSASEPSREQKPVVQRAGNLRLLNGNLSAERVARLYGVGLNQIASWIGRSRQAVARRPNADSLQDPLDYFERIAQVRRTTQSDSDFRKWLRTPNSALDNRSPMDIIEAKEWKNLADKVDAMLAENPASQEVHSTQETVSIQVDETNQPEDAQPEDPVKQESSSSQENPS